MSESVPFSVLGIALVVEERGKGARLVFRYPAVPEDCDADNLFFTLPHRIMAKIFRPKKRLCNQPMTISLGGTVFCCRAVLMSAEHVKDASALVLFSVIVSLVPTERSSALPIAGWFEGDVEGPASDIVSKKELQAKKSDLTQVDDNENRRKHLRGSTSFLAVRKIHVSLARVCRVLEREERRCRYVAIQSARLQKIAEDYKTLKLKNSTTVSSSTSEIGSLRHRRTMTAGAIGEGAVFTEMALDWDDTGNEVRKRQGHHQEVTDLMLAAKVEGLHIHGNLARELLQVFHAMSRTHEDSAPISSAILSARDCTVFINRHIAVPIDSIAQNVVEDLIHGVRPYHTLLFPQVAAAELADTFTSSNSRMKQFLSTLDSSKSLSEVSIDAAMPLASVIEMASYLLSNTVCIVSHVIRKDSTLACFPGCIDRMNELSLPFSQVFGLLSIHCVVSLLTMGCTIEQLLNRLVDGERIDIGLVGGALQRLITNIHFSREEEKTNSRQKAKDDKEKQLDDTLARESNMVSPLPGNGGGNNSHKELLPDDDTMNPYDTAVSALEDYLMKMAAWLGAHRIVIPKQEYLVACNVNLESASSQSKLIMRTESSSVSRFFEENLCDELVAEGCLNGKVSTVAMCWMFRIDERSLARLRSWGRKRRTISSVWRVPNIGDDEWVNDEGF
ncbi:hypothetical protein MHU86_19920 [Fragilaria crotonensis]|nr:hypothetical protein MHU86_19920 [Fragilaria crotonensis]